jgi:outer membrane protein assembly factor BamD (BamD/ComL family)
LDKQTTDCYPAAMTLVKRLAALLLVAFLAGCSNKNIDTTKLQAAFPTNDGGNQELVTQGIDAISKTNYPAALDTLEKLSYRPQITKEQRIEVQNVVAQLKERIRKGQ